MAMGGHELTSRAVERARSRLPGFAPDSAEVVALARDATFVVVRGGDAGLLVLDRVGRPVRSCERLIAIASHARTIALLSRSLADGKLEQRREHAERSLEILRRARRVRAPVARQLGVTCDRLGALARAIEAAEQAARPREAPPTERTARRAAILLNEAAAADRQVVAEARRLAAEVLKPPRATLPVTEEKLLRWAVGRLGSADLPFFLPELDASETDRWVEAFVASARATAAAIAT